MKIKILLQYYVAIVEVERKYIHQILAITVDDHHVLVKNDCRQFDLSYKNAEAMEKN